MPEEKDECEVCAAHNVAYAETKLELLKCPKCGTYIEDKDILYLFGAENIISDSMDQGPFVKRVVYACQNQECLFRFVLEWKLVIWNANHDIYYFNPPQS